MTTGHLKMVADLKNLWLNLRFWAKSWCSYSLLKSAVCFSGMWTSAGGGLNDPHRWQIDKNKRKKSEVTEQLVKSCFSCLLTMEEFPSFAKNIFLIPYSEGLGKKKTLSSASRTLAVGGVRVCVWMCVCSDRCLVVSQHSFLLSGLLRLTATLNTHVFTQEFWCGVRKFLRWCANTCSSNTSLHVFGLNKTDAVL